MDTEITQIVEDRYIDREKLSRLLTAVFGKGRYKVQVRHPALLDIGRFHARSDTYHSTRATDGSLRHLAC